MSQSQNEDRRKMMEKLAGSMMLLSFGLAMLAFLIAIDRPEWFNLRPASGTAAAMSKASSHNAVEQDTEDNGTDNRIARLKSHAGHGTN